MTIACLIVNTVRAACAIRGLPAPAVVSELERERHSTDRRWRCWLPHAGRRANGPIASTPVRREELQAHQGHRGGGLRLVAVPRIQEPGRAAERRRPAHVRDLRSAHEGEHRRSETFPGFNDVYEGTVEWRIEKSRRQGASVRHDPALEYRDAEDQEKRPARSSRRTRAGGDAARPGGMCHVGYVDGARIQTRTSLRASSPTSAPARSSAARTRDVGCAGSDIALADLTVRSALILPAERDLIEALGAEALRRARDRSAAERPVELDRRIVVGQRPDHQALQVRSARDRAAPR